MAIVYLADRVSIYTPKTSLIGRSLDIHKTEPHPPGKEAPVSGIYTCATCYLEAVSSKGEPLPPQHSDCEETVWLLAVEAQHKP